ncbi:MAG: hypothetical protein DGJ47_000998 [Rickettsiaceae bacterium]
MGKKALGRGLSSLLKEEIVPLQVGQPESILKVEYIRPNSDQPRKKFDEDKLQELSGSIATHGVLQPILVKKIDDKNHVIIAGERRFRASLMAGLKELPVVIKDFTDQEILEVALVENIQRQELNVIEEAMGYQKLIEDFNYSQQKIADTIGKSRSHVANILRLNQLDAEIKQLVVDGSLSMGHARCLIGYEKALEVAIKAISEQMSVRELEKFIATEKKPQSEFIAGRDKKSGLSVAHGKEGDDDLRMLANSLSEKFGVKVIIENFNNMGKISFHYNNLEELDSILTKID